MADWRPSATVDVLRRRADLLACIRSFFAQRGVMEVDVPALAHASVTDPNIDSFAVRSLSGTGEQYLLMTSPEFYMKRLLAANAGPIYYLGHAFRAGDAGARHSPEFTMLEWYRPQWSLGQLMDEVAALVATFVSGAPIITTYRQVFVDYAGIDPFLADTGALKALAKDRLSPAFDSDDRSIWLDLVFSHLVEPQIKGMVFITGFPAEQAALAQTSLDAAGNAIALRFELYIDGLEIANGYQEELNADVLADRFRENLRIRADRQQVLPEIDQCFLSAMRDGMPPCAGVALGVDRLLMQACAAGKISSVMPFSL